MKTTPDQLEQTAAAAVEAWNAEIYIGQAVEFQSHPEAPPRSFAPHRRLCFG